MLMTYTEALAVAYRRALIGTQAYALAQSPDETRTARQIFDALHGDANHAPLSWPHGIAN